MFSTLRGVARPLVASIFWGAAFICIPISLQAFSPTELLALRFGLAGVGFLLLFRLGIVKYRPIERAHWPRFALITFLSVPAYNGALNLGQLHLPASVAVLLVQLSPVLILLAGMVGGRRRGLLQWLTLGTSIAGLLALAMHFRELSLAGAPWWALPVLALAPIAQAAYMLLSPPLLERYGAANVCGQMFIWGGGAMFLLFGLDGGLLLALRNAGTAPLLAALALVSFTTITAYLLWFIEMERRGPQALALYLGLVPVWGLLGAVLALGETFSIWLLISGGLTVGGHMMLNSLKRKG